MVDSKQQWKAWLYLAPAIVLLLVFTVWPIINTVRLAFLEGYNALEATWGATYEIGIGNFLEVLDYDDPDEDYTDLLAEMRQAHLDADPKNHKLWR